ncbi:MAG TPA: hypothetical protein VEO54_06245 [Thermoanaerobaculia bacterium]|nr:hypothetical protein [Thermoanaerobaculia bacterium]
MNKILLGVILGAVLGIFDGATAWATPEVRKDIIGIIIGSTMKGVIAGVAAGIFARKVKNTAAGIAFGLAVGLALAYLVVYLGGGKYFFEIMLPGGAVGAILGWATQRYGRPANTSRAAAFVAMFAVMLFAVSAQAHDGHDHAKKPAAHAVFEKLKGLEGTWDATMLAPDGEKTTVVYKVSANGTVVQETMFVGSPMEMITMYTVDGDSIVATHYCAGDNQPTLRLNPAKSKADEAVFDFVNVRGKSTKGHINGVTMKFGADGRLAEEAWSTSNEATHMKLYLKSKR